jgi:ABC-2 type transport system ATP-binding protein
MLEIKERFKEHLYEFVFEGDEEALTNELSEKVAIEESRGEKANLTVKVKLPSGFDSNELLKIIIKHGILHAFSEVLPSMNDIFIQMVESQKQAP